MSSLTDADKRYLRKILVMESGLVLDYSNATYGELFRRHKIDIHGPRYQTHGPSKAKKMRAFWEQEPDHIVAPVLKDILDSHEVDCEINRKVLDKKLFDKSLDIVARLGGKSVNKSGVETEDSFLRQEFKIPNLQKLPIDSQVAKIVEQRLKEVHISLKYGAHLSVIFMCGSVLEAVLLGAAQRNSEKFNRALSSPKDSKRKVRPLPDWTLAQLINVAYEVNFLKLDVKKFSYGLRDFRNYIHPYEQLVSRFDPDKHTAKMCFQALKAALANLAGDR